MSTNLGDGPNGEPTSAGGNQDQTGPTGKTGPVKLTDDRAGLQPTGPRSGDQIEPMTKNEAIRRAHGNFRTIKQMAEDMESDLYDNFPEIFKEPEPELPPGAVRVGVVRPSHKE